MSPWVGMVHQKTSKQQHFPGQQALFSVGSLTHERKAPESLGNKALTTLARVTRAFCLSCELKIHNRTLENI